MKTNTFILLIAFFLTACGGAGTEEEKQSKKPTIKLEKNILYFQAEEGLPLPSIKEDIRFKIENLNKSIYIVAKNNNPELVEKIYFPFFNTSSESSLTVYAAQPFFTGLKKGTYQGSITLSLCEDEECTKPVSNSTVTISIVYDVL